MNFRTKVLLSTTSTVAIAVWIVAWFASAAISQSFEARDRQRVGALVNLLRTELAHRGEDVARRVEAIANSQALARIAAEPGDYSAFLNDAQALAQDQSLDLLEIVASDTSIISSAQWPARFGYKETWLAAPADWKKQSAFLKQEELAEGSVLALVAVRTVSNLYVAGGQRIDAAFLKTLALPEGLSLSLYQASDPSAPREFVSLVQQERLRPREITSQIGDDTVTAIPLSGPAANLLGVLFVRSSGLELAAVRSYIRRTALVVGAAGAFIGILLSLWASARVTRPVRELAGSVRQVAEGKWDTRATVSSSDEIGRLAADFNHMTEQLVDSRERLVQTERVAAWRELARRLAHELKNPLFPLQITVENLQRSRALPPKEFEEVFEESTGTLLAELNTLKAIVGRFSDFARMPAPHKEDVDLNQIVERVIKLYDAQLCAPGRPQIRPDLQLASYLPHVSADPEQLQRVLSNLVLNAIDAMPNGGKISISTRDISGRVVLEVTDTGEGLTKEECERLFTPYYTTKQHGTGLGLAIVQSVVSDHGGAISVQSEPGRGSTFRIELGSTGPERI
jgi:two-component system, NtrC family, nitrogen regulation sensor histidine kinase NtrY